MKSKFLLLALGLLSFGTNAQVLYEENFDGCALPADWTLETTVGDTTWSFGDNATGTPGGSVDGTCMAFFHDDDYGNGTPALIIDLNTPVWDLSAQDTAELHFDYMFQTLGASFSVAIWNGANWDTVWTTNTDPICTGQFFPGCTAEEVAINVSDYLNADFQAKFIYNDGDAWDWYVGLDNVSIYIPPTDDAQAQMAISPADGCGMTATETVSFTIYNNGQNEISAFDCGYTINGGAANIETFNITIPSAGTGTVTFAAPVDLSVPGTYDFQAWVTLAGDPDAANDTIWYSVESIPVITGLPYFEDFESGNAGWTAEMIGTEGVWELGDPEGNNIDTAFSGTNAWATNLDSLNYPNGMLSYLYSPCMDFSSLAIDPIIRFATVFDSEFNYDAAWVEVSTDAGASFSLVGNVGGGFNWYTNDTYFNAAIDQGFSGPSVDTSWVVAQHILDGVAGSSSVIVRFAFASDGSVNGYEGAAIDDIEIFEQPPINAGIVEILSPITGCGLGDEAVTVVIENFGDAALVNYPVAYDLGGGAVVETVTDTLHIADTDTFTFSSLADLNLPSTYNLGAWTEVVGDGDNLNDSLFTVVTSSPVISSLPYEEDFESGEGGWYATMEGDEGIWEFGDPEGLLIDTANSGINAWASNLNTDNYPNGMLSYLYSPCFDLSTLAIDPILEFAIIFDSEFSYDGAWVESSIDGGNTWNLVGNLGEGENWYTNDNFFNAVIDQGFAGQSATPVAWINAEHLLDGTAGSADVMIRFGFASDGSVNFYDGVAIDDISLTEQPPINGELISLDSPVSGCSLSDSSLVSVTVTNIGSVAIDSVMLSYSVNGGTMISQMWMDTLLTGDTASYTFDEVVDLSVPGDYTITAIMTTIGDGDMEDDTVSVVVQSIPVVDSFPYDIDFENGTGGWSSAGGTNGNWELGDPEGTLIDTAFSGVNAWSSNLNTLNYENGQLSYLMSPCLDFSSFTEDPLLSFATIFNSEFNYDGFFVESTTDGGISWDLVGSVGQGSNWYTNDNFFNIQITEGFAGESGTGTEWVIAESIVEGVAGESSVRLRFTFASDGSVNGYEGAAIDDISIREQAQLDLAAFAMEAPETGCDLGNETVRITYWNRGTNVVTNYDLGYTYNGNTVIETSGIQLFQGDTATYAFNTPVDLSAVGMHEITVFTALAGDEDMDNDTVANNMVEHLDVTPESQSIITSVPIAGNQPAAVSEIYFCGLPQSLNNCFQIENVTIDNIEHSWMSSLDITLVSPAGDSLDLSLGNGGGQAGTISGVEFADGTNGDITTQQNGFIPGVYNPQGAGGFASFHDGQDPNGAWQLVVNDNSFGDVGTINGWSMAFTSYSPEPELSLDDTEICINHVIQLSATAGMDSYLWNTGDNGQTIDIDGAALGAGTFEYSVTVDEDGCTGYSDTITITVDECVGIVENNGVKVNLYPNPTEGDVVLELIGNTDAMMLDVIEPSGRIVHHETLPAGTIRHNFDLTKVASGVYTVRLMMNGAVTSQKLFVK